MRGLKALFSSPGNISLPLGVLTLLLGVSSHFTKVEAQSQENNIQITEIKQRQDEYNRVIAEISSRLSRIEGALQGLKRYK